MRDETDPTRVNDNPPATSNNVAVIFLSWWRCFFAKYENKAPGQKKREVGEAVPYGRMGKAEDLTGMAVFLASDDADYVVSQCYNVDGGQWMS